MFSIGQTVSVRYIDRHQRAQCRVGHVVNVITAHWSKSLARYRIRLVDGTEIISTGVDLQPMTDPAEFKPP